MRQIKSRVARRCNQAPDEASTEGNSPAKASASAVPREFSSQANAQKSRDPASNLPPVRRQNDIAAGCVAEEEAEN
jgi:hypothetical protein